MFWGWTPSDLKSGWNDVKGDGKWGAVGFVTLGIGGLGYLLLEKAWAIDKANGNGQISKVAEATSTAFDVFMHGIGFGVELGLLGGVSLVGLKLWQTLRQEEMVSLRLVPKGEARTNPQRVGEMVKEFRQMYHRYPWRKRAWVKWQIIRTPNGLIEFRIITPKRHAGVIAKRFANAYPDVSLAEEPIMMPSFFDPSKGEAAHMRLNTLPWQKERGLNGSLTNRMGDVLNLMPHGSIMEITFSPSSLKPIEKRAREVIAKMEQHKQKKDTAAIIEKIRARYEGNRTAFDVFVDVWSMNPMRGFLGEISARTEGFAKLKGRPYLIGAKHRTGIHWESRFRTLAKWQASRLTDRELAPFFLLPEAGHPVWEFIQRTIPRPPVSDSDFRGEYAMGFIDSDDPKQDGRPARLRTDCLTNHGLIAGASGGGKGSAIMMFVKQDFLPKWLENKPDSLGLTLCDPHTEDILLTLAHLLDLEDQGVAIPWERVRVISFGDAGADLHPVAANLLHLEDENADLDQIAADAEETILNAFDSSNLTQSAAHLMRAIQGLLHLPGQKSLLDIVRLFEATPEGHRLRNAVIDATKRRNPVVSEWWRRTHEEITRTGKDMKVSAIDTRIAPLIARRSMQRFFCRDGNFFADIPQWIEDGYLVLIDFRGADDEMFRLCAAWLAKQYFLASQERGTGGRPHLLLFDEVQKFSATDIFFKIITENRKFGLGLVLVTQMVEQLDDKLKTAIKSNAGFVLSVRQAAGAKPMAELLGEPFTPDELKELEKGLEACISSFNGKARLRLEYPAYPLNGQATAWKSDDERKAKQRAEAKFLELLARDHVPAEEADREVRRFVYGERTAEAEAAASMDVQDNVVNMRGTKKRKI